MSFYSRMEICFSVFRSLEVNYTHTFYKYTSLQSVNYFSSAVIKLHDKEIYARVFKLVYSFRELESMMEE